MKLLLAFVLIAAATAAEVPVKPVVLGRAPLPQVVESPLQTSKIQVVDSAPVAPAIETVKFLDSAPVPDTAEVEMVRFIDSPLEIAPEDLHDIISKAELETIRIVQAAVDAVKFVNEAEPQAPVLAESVEQVRFVDSPAEQQIVEQVRFVDSPAEEHIVEQVRFVDSPAEEQIVEQVRFVDSPAVEQIVEQVRFVDSPAEEQIDAAKVAEIPQVAPEESFKVRVVDFAPVQRPGKIFDNDMLR